MKFKAHSFLLFPLFLLAGCASTRVHFEGVGPDGRVAPEVRYVLQSTSGNEGSITVHSHGYRHASAHDRDTDVVHFHVVVDNASEDVIEIPLATVTAHDDQPRSFTRLVADMPEGSTTDTAIIRPRSRAAIVYDFDLGAPGAFRSTGSITLEWAYRFRGQETRHQTRFLPVHYRRPTYVHTGFYYGPSWHYPHGYYW